VSKALQEHPEGAEMPRPFAVAIDAGIRATVAAAFAERVAEIEQLDERLKALEARPPPAAADPADLRQLIYRQREVLALTKISRSTLYDRIARGRFPRARVNITEKIKGWLASDVHAWLDAQTDKPEGDRAA
jgi:predicted DNA-binding transcriptional regulator AlpA